MKQMAQNALRPAYHLMLRLIRESAIVAYVRKARQELLESRNESIWRQKGSPAPPPARFKRRFLRNLAVEHKLRVFVETGTLHGETIEALENCFLEIYSIELDDSLFRNAQSKFKNSKTIRLRKGDSAEQLPKVLCEIRQPALFWLDAHYSGVGTARGQQDTPILIELSALACHSLHHKHVIVIDDARDFNGTDGYPTLEELRAQASSLGFNSFRLSFDMIVFQWGDTSL